MIKQLRLVLTIMIVMLSVGCASMIKEPKEAVDFDELVEDALDEYGNEFDLQLLDVFEKDFDDDGQKEHIAFYGEEGDLQAAICLREDEDELQIIDFKLDAKGYIFEEANVVKLEDSDIKFIQLTVSNGVSFQGVAIYELEGNQIENILYLADPMAEEDAYLVDEDDNGEFDAAVTTRYLYDSQNHEIHYSYAWDGDRFIDAEVVVLYGNDSGKFIQPTHPEELVFNYFEGYIVNQMYMPISEEMNAMVENTAVLDVKIENIFSEEDDQSLYDRDLFTFLEIEALQIGDSSATIKAIGSKGSLIFELSFDENWLIADIYEETSDYQPNSEQHTTEQPSAEQPENDGILLSEEFTTEDYVQYTLELKRVYTSEPDTYDNIVIYKETNGKTVSVFDFQELGLNIVGAQLDLGAIYYSYEDLDLDGSKELYFADTAAASNFTKKLVIGYFNQKFQVMFYDEIYQIGYQDIDEDGINELVGATIPGGQVSYDIGFREAFQRVDNRYYHHQELTKKFALKIQEQAENQFALEESVVNLNRLICYSAYNGDQKRIDELLISYEEMITPIIKGLEYNEDNMFIQNYPQMIDYYRERWQLMEIRDQEMAIILEDY